MSTLALPSAIVTAPLPLPATPPARAFITPALVVPAASADFSSDFSAADFST